MLCRTCIIHNTFLNSFVLFYIVTLILSVTACSGRVYGAENIEGRFFLAGDGKVNLRNEKTGQEIHVKFLNPDGSINKSARSAIDDNFGITGRGKEENISLRLIFMLDYFTDRIAPGKLIHLISGYRSPVYNKKLKDSGGNVALTSTHMDGMALDFYIDGIEGKKIWEIIRKENCCGVGHYGGKSVHIDSGRPRFWEATTSKVKTGESEYNRRIYLTTEYDRYKAGSKLRLSLTSISDYGFSIRNSVSIVRDREGEVKEADFNICNESRFECIPVRDRGGARSFSGMLPRNLQPGKYRIRLDFCEKPFDVMPSKTVSNEIEIVAGDKYPFQSDDSP